MGAASVEEKCRDFSLVWLIEMYRPDISVPIAAVCECGTLSEEIGRDMGNREEG